ncbi:MAG: GatB/YqeY domain-containing protein [Hyphomicrobiales bacterium]
MSLRETFNTVMKEALKAGDKPRLSAVRLINAAVKDRDIEARGAGKGQASEDEIVALLQKMVKQRHESAGLYEKGARPELAAQERAEIAVISSFLPQQLGESEVAAAIKEAIIATGAAGIKDMGKVMAALKERHAGRMDFSKAGPAVKAALSG